MPGYFNGVNAQDIVDAYIFANKILCSGGRDDLSSDMFKWPETARGFLALLLWWTHILEADFCCIILKIFFRAKVYFFVISYFGAKDS